MNLINKILIKINSDFVGEDEYGHRYYLSQSTDYLGNRKRLVIYSGENEPSKIPPLWHAWLHYLTDIVPLKGKFSNYKWQKDHLPNLTGTKDAYFPEGHVKNKNMRVKVSSDYKPWVPD